MLSTNSHQQQSQSITNYTSIESGLDFILSHFSGPLFSRTISTNESRGSQFIVDSKEEALIAYSDSKYLDCRINGFPLLREGKSWIPDLLFIDLDGQKSMDIILSKTLSNITRYLVPHAKPTVLMSGNGYHIIQPVECPVNDYQIRQAFDKELASFCVNGNPAEEFLRFAKTFLSNGKADRNHNPSFRSCMLRIPITINSKNDKVVQIIREWNGCRPQLTKELFVLFEDYLIQKKIEHELLQEKIFKERLKNKKRKQIGYNISNNCHQSNYYEWIEKLLQTPLEDYRKNAVSLILSTYLINIKKKSYEDSFVILKDWLDRCYKLKRLDFNAGYLIKYSLNTALKNKIPPMKLETIKERNYELYKIIIDHEKSK